MVSLQFNSTRLLAIPINNESEPFKFTQLHLSNWHKWTICFTATLPLLILFPIARKQFSQAKQLCIFQPYNYKTVIPIHNDLYLIYWDIQQLPTYNCNRNLWRNTTSIEAGISLITVPSKCELNFLYYQLMAKELIVIPYPSVIQLFTLSSVSPDSRISSTNIIAILAISAISIVNLIIIFLILKQLILFYFFRPQPFTVLFKFYP